MNRIERDTRDWFRDMTDVPGAEQAADNVPELRAGFEELGFRRVGFLGEYEMPGKPTLWVYEVLSSANGDAFLTLYRAPDGPLRNKPRIVRTATLETALEDGSIIITTTHDKHLWSLDHPRAGVYLEGWSEVSPEELWYRHQQRVEDLARKRDRSVLRHDSMPLRLWIAGRCIQIGSHVAFVALLMGLAAFVAVLITLVQLKDWLQAGVGAWFGQFWQLFWFAGLLVILAVGVWLVRNRVVLGWLGGQWLARQFPWPRRQRYHCTEE
jgi:hypothetical protein